MAEWQDISTAPTDGTWFVALPNEGLGFSGEPYPPTVCKVVRQIIDINTGEPTDDFDVYCKAMNSGAYWRLSDFRGWQPLPEPKP